MVFGEKEASTHVYTLHGCVHVYALHGCVHVYALHGCCSRWKQRASFRVSCSVCWSAQYGVVLKCFVFEESQCRLLTSFSVSGHFAMKEMQCKWVRVASALLSLFLSLSLSLSLSRMLPSILLCVVMLRSIIRFKMRGTLFL